MDKKVVFARIAYGGTMALVACLARAQSAAPAVAATVRPIPPQAETPQRLDRAEPAVLHHLTEDGGSKIDELVVRGELQHVIVTPKVGTSKSYEIIVQRGGRTPPDSTGGATSAIGKRVWNVFAF